MELSFQTYEYVVSFLSEVFEMNPEENIKFFIRWHNITFSIQVLHRAQEG